MYQKLFSPVKIGRMEVKNRVAKTSLGDAVRDGRIIDATQDAYGQAFVFEP